MKVWKITSNWLHIKSNKEINVEFIVVTNDIEDPIETIKHEYDMSGMVFKQGDCNYIEPPFAYHKPASFQPFPKKQ